MKNNSSLLLALAAFIAGAALTKYYWPSIKVETKERETVITKTITKIRHVKHKDGSESTETDIIDTGREDRSKSQSQKLAPKWAAGAQVHASFNGLKPDYSLDVSRRIFGPFHVVVSGRTNGSFGAGLRVEF